MSKYTSKWIDCSCGQCGIHFKTIPGRIKQGRGQFCSKQCFYLSRRKRVDCICEQCGKSFEVIQSVFEDRGAKYCSPGCATDAVRTQVDCVCLTCGKSFKDYVSGIARGQGKYCSRECNGVSQRGENHHHWRGGHINYRGKNWNQQRKAAYGRDKGTCQYCGKKPKIGQRRFQVHHIKPYREFKGDYLAANELTNLITLCPQCHPAAENGKIVIQPYLF